MLISQSDLEARLGRSLSTNEVSTFAIINPAMQRSVERLIGSSIENVSETTRRYDGGLTNLPIDPCTDVTSVKVIDEDDNLVELVDTSDYTLEPVNRTLKTMVRYRWGKFPRGFNVIQVAAKFSIYGDSELLAIVKNALLDMLASEINRSDNIKRESIEGYSIEYATTETQDVYNTLMKHFQIII